MPYTGNYTKGSINAINHTEIEDGKFRVSTDTSELFIDLGNTRHHISDFIFSYTQEEITGGDVTSPNVRKFYMASDTYRVYKYDSTNHEFVDITGFPAATAYTAGDPNGGNSVVDDTDWDFGEVTLPNEDED